ncbi:unnamed protein product [Clonostachys rosea]|uniref:Uncharacterized protein n=1 Tax=Bionectria ochroleuca TaxID=29856 RepID=A0ABY6TW08_BIOOC|nr:unnamed protein product [Clonostachys rosea]
MLPVAVEPRVEHGLVAVQDARVPVCAVVDVILYVGEHICPVVLAAGGGRKDEVPRGGHHVAEDVDLRGELAAGHEADEGAEGHGLVLHTADHGFPPGPEVGGRAVGLISKGGLVGEEAVLIGDVGGDEVSVLHEVALDEDAPQQLGGDVVRGLGDVHESGECVDHGLRPQLLGAVG